MYCYCHKTITRVPIRATPRRSKQNLLPLSHVSPNIPTPHTLLRRSFITCTLLSPSDSTQLPSTPLPPFPPAEYTRWPRPLLSFPHILPSAREPHDSVTFMPVVSSYHTFAASTKLRSLRGAWLATRRMGSLAYRRTYTFSGLPWSSRKCRRIIACGDKRKQSWSPPPPLHTQAWCCAVVCSFCVVGSRRYWWRKEPTGM